VKLFSENMGLSGKLQEVGRRSIGVQAM
jgi:hypothetical protein